MAVHQLVAGARQGDAITNEARTLQKTFQGWSPDARIFCPARTLDPKLRGEVDASDAFPELADPSRDTILLHLSIGSPIQDIYRQWPGAKVILYHNVTPPHWFSAIAPATARLLEEGLRQVQALAGTADRVWADSRYNADELETMGYGPVDVLPLVIPFDQLSVPPATHIRTIYSPDRFNLLFVGRGAPNKRFEDLIRLQAVLERQDFPSRLILVGSFGGTELYASLLQGMTKELNLRHVHFEGPRPQAELNAYYQAADLFVCMSEHEGFCAPLMEAMQFELPILAFQACAVPETLGGAGILLTHKENALLTTELTKAILQDRPLNEAITKSQNERLTHYKNRNLEQELDHMLSGLPH